MKQFVKALSESDQCYKYLESKFSHEPDAKLKEGIFDRPEIIKMLKNDNFPTTMTAIQKAAWISFKKVIENFLGNH